MRQFTKFSQRYERHTDVLLFFSLPQVSLFYKLLICLAVFDVVFVLTGGLFIVQLAFRFDFPWYNRTFPTIIYPVAGISMTGMHSFIHYHDRKTSYAINFIWGPLPD